MIQKINTPVSISLIFDHRLRKTRPTALLWEGKTHKIIHFGLHHSYRTGRILFHIFSVASETLFFRLSLNTESLIWTLEEISDGESN